MHTVEVLQPEPVGAAESGGAGAGGRGVTLYQDLFNGIIVDNFAGGGGAYTGIKQATGRDVDIAINHDPAAIAMHKANLPYTEHLCESVWDVDPRQVVQGRPV